MTDYATLLARFSAIAAEAGQRIVEVRSRPHDVVAKADGSPLTEADLAADAVIAAGLPAAAPGIALGVVIDQADRLSGGHGRVSCGGCAGRLRVGGSGIGAAACRLGRCA